MNPDSAFHILLVDDHAIVREGLAALLNRQADMQVIAEAANGKEAIETYRAHLPNLVLMDISMPEMDGITATRLLCREFPDAHVVLLSSVDDVFARGQQAGAEACLLKDASREELLSTIRGLSRASEVSQGVQKTRTER